MRRQVGYGIAVVAAAWFAYWQFARLAGAQTPRVFFDSAAYLQIADTPMGWARLWAVKPPVVPIVDGWAGGEPARIQVVQIVAAMVAWSLFAGALVAALRRPWVRAVGVGVGVAFLLAAPRIGWTGSVLSESVNDSLLALVAAGALACVIARAPRARRALIAATTVAALAWIFTRDTNAITLVAALPIAALAWRGWPRAAIAAAVVLVAASGVTLWATRIPPEPLPWQQGYWVPAMTARATYPMLDNVLGRVMDADRDWLAARGAPVDDFARLKDADVLVGNTPDKAAAQAWMLEHGTGTYLRWLVRHPIDRAVELATDWTAVLSGRYAQTMPADWKPYDRAHPVLEVLRRVTTNRWVLLALLLGSPALAFRPRRDPRRLLGLVLLASGLVGAAAAYYGDSAELSRHCYGSGQQIVIALFVLLLARLDGQWPGRALTPRPTTNVA